MKVVLLVFAFVFSLQCTPRTFAQELGDFGVGHAQWHEWYETAENGGPLMRPTNPNIRCCGSDCRPTKAKFENGRWLVWVDRGWEPVPNESIKQNISTPNGQAHVCSSLRSEWSRPTIFCFVLPESGS